MNWAQFGMFAVFVFCVWTAGIAIYGFLDPKGSSYNRALYLGETLLLGSILVVGEMFALSLVKLYSKPFLWGIVGSNLLFFLLPHTRRHCAEFFTKKTKWDFSLAGFILLAVFFFFRNCYFLVDADSHSTYLYAQKLWLEHGTSIFAGPAMDMRVFVPQFNAVPYALGLSVFPFETLFPQLIVVFWTLIAVFLVFGYVSHKFSRPYALAAVMMVLFNDHMFFSGANSCCIINTAVVALLFGIVYNFWEARQAQNENGFRFVLAFIFATQVLANKYQAAAGLVFIVLAGLLVQPDLKSKIRTVLQTPSFRSIFLGAVVLALLWPLKSFLATGCPAFPIGAGEMGILDWNKPMAQVLKQHFIVPLSLPQIVKYFTWMFFWPGIHAAKILGYAGVFLPSVLLLYLFRRDLNKERLLEVCFWVTAAQLMMIGLCLVQFVDPRNYRFAIAVNAAAVIFVLNFILEDCLRLSRRWRTFVVLLIAVQGWSIMLHQGGDFKRPAMKDNIAVLQNKLNMKHMMFYYYPESVIVFKELRENAAKFQQAAWDVEWSRNAGLSAFLLPTRPQVGLWHTTAVKWDSYADPSAVVRDLNGHGIRWIMAVENGHMVFESVEDYAARAVKFDRLPDKIFFNYGFPEELRDIRYSRKFIVEAFGIQEK